MGGMLIVDDNGDVWPVGAPRLREVLMCPDPDFDIAGYAVHSLGFVQIRQVGRMVRIEMRPALIKPPTLIGLYYAMLDMQPDQIMLSRFDAAGVSHELFSDVSEFAATIERDIGDKATERYRGPYELLRRPLYSLGRSRYSRFRPVVEFWHAMHGRLSEELMPLLRRHGLERRAVLARKPSGSGRLVYEHMGSGYSFICDACWPLLAVGRDIELLPDPEYGAWATRSYHECLTERELRLETVSAVIRRADGQPLWTYYDRVLMPWQAGNGSMFVLGISELRRRVLAA